MSAQRRDEFVVFADAGAKHRRKKFKVFFHTQILIERKSAGHIANQRAQAFVIAHDVKSQHGCRAAVGQHQRRKDAKQSGFARAVGTDQAKNFTFAHLERDVAEGLHRAVRF
jgi:hypothetical protein